MNNNHVEVVAPQPQGQQVAQPGTSGFKVTKKAQQAQEVAQDVIASLLSQKDDAVDHDLAALGMKMRKDLDEDQLDECMMELQHVVMKHIKKARASRRLARERDEYLANPVSGPMDNHPAGEDQYIAMPPPPMAVPVLQVGNQELYNL